MLGHPPAEINVWLPLTAAFDSNTMRLCGITESIAAIKACDADFRGFDERSHPEFDSASKPVTLGIGRYIAFNPRCIHATQFNRTDDTRVSIDFRVIPVRAYERLRLHYRGTGRNPMAFAPGEYYSAAATAT